MNEREECVRTGIFTMFVRVTLVTCFPFQSLTLSIVFFQQINELISVCISTNLQTLFINTSVKNYEFLSQL